ncbi:MAG: hypothetical protein D6732_04000 [Methanobacteriota archaeon]|nr:MAG: hypothetical protein D6732_04000 [Euryarchaeota archaeon]
MYRKLIGILTLSVIVTSAFALAAPVSGNHNEPTYSFNMNFGFGAYEFEWDVEAVLRELIGLKGIAFSFTMVGSYYLGNYTQIAQGTLKFNYETDIATKKASVDNEISVYLRWENHHLVESGFEGNSQLTFCPWTVKTNKLYALTKTLGIKEGSWKDLLNLEAEICFGLNFDWNIVDKDGYGKGGNIGIKLWTEAKLTAAKFGVEQTEDFNHAIEGGVVTTGKLYLDLIYRLKDDLGNIIDRWTVKGGYETSFSIGVTVDGTFYGFEWTNSNEYVIYENGYNNAQNSFGDMARHVNYKLIDGGSNEDAKWGFSNALDITNNTIWFNNDGFYHDQVAETVGYIAGIYKDTYKIGKKGQQADVYVTVAGPPVQFRLCYGYDTQNPFCNPWVTASGGKGFDHVWIKEYGIDWIYVQIMGTGNDNNGFYGMKLYVYDHPVSF